MTDHHTTSQTPAAPGWYPDGSGGQRWWDGRGWTEHTAPAAAPALNNLVERPRLPEGARIDTVWVWCVSLATLVAAVPIFFFDFSGYMRAVMQAELSGNTSALPATVTSYMGFILIMTVLGWAAWGFTVFAAYRDHKHLVAIGVVRPFHWALAFIPYTIVYLIGRHVVLRKVSRTAGWPLWAHIASYVVLIAASIVWSVVMVQSMMADFLYY